MIKVDGLIKRYGGILAYERDDDVLADTAALRVFSAAAQPGRLTSAADRIASSPVLARPPGSRWPAPGTPYCNRWPPTRAGCLVSIVSSIVGEVLKLHGVAAYAVIRRLGVPETALQVGWQPRSP